MSGKTYSGIPIDQRRTWIVPRWLKEVFVGIAVAAVAAVGISKFVGRGSKLDRAKAAVDAQDLQGAARPIVLPKRGGGTFDLGQQRGKLVLVNFWATWCPPCVEEMPSLGRLAQLMDPATFQLVAVSVDDGWGPIEKFFTDRPTAYPVALDRGARTSVAFGSSRYPETYLVDGQGNLKLKFTGPRNWSDERVVALLEQLGAKRVARPAGPEPKAHAGQGG